MRTKYSILSDDKHKNFRIKIDLLAKFSLLVMVIIMLVITLGFPAFEKIQSMNIYLRIIGIILLLCCIYIAIDSIRKGFKELD